MIWLTPDGIEDLLPIQAHKLEYYRRKLLDNFELAGYKLIVPPIAEFTDSLITGTGKNKINNICRFTDQESGKMMGIRSDVTPQAARIVTNRLKPNPMQIPVRLCYALEVLKTKNNIAKGSRSPIQAGVELFGISSVDADIEVIELMLDSLFNSGLKKLTLSIGHVSIVNELMELSKFSIQQKKEFINILKRKSVPEYEVQISSIDMPVPIKQAFKALLDLNGSPNKVLELSEMKLKGLSTNLDNYLQDLHKIHKYFSLTNFVDCIFDLSDIRGHDYHTGIIFSSYEQYNPMYLLAKGGRYDGIGVQFGKNLPATGFSLDLRGALDIFPDLDNSKNCLDSECIYAPISSDVELKNLIKQLRKDGNKVIRTFENQKINKGSKILIKEQSNKWVIRKA